MKGEELYEIVASLCVQRGISITALAKGIGISPSAVSDWKNKQSQPRARTIKAVADYFGVPIGYLYGDADIPTINTANIVEGDNNSNIKQIISDKQQLPEQEAEILRIVSQLGTIDKAKTLLYVEGLAKENEKPPATAGGN